MAFPAIIEIYIADNSKNFWELSWFSWLFCKKFEIWFLHPMRRSMRILFKMRNLKELKNDIFDQQSWGFFQLWSFTSSRLEEFYKKVVINNFEKFTRKNVPQSLFLNKVASLSLLKIDSNKRAFCKFCNIWKLPLL